MLTKPELQRLRLLREKKKPAKPPRPLASSSGEKFVGGIARREIFF